ncbi:uncharacterized protein TRUGW13939_02972 [Talaromyces rugulosus]|uniref:BZIP domain-containing protein n=1 Tax=Talaromyces rugulosus TaxID=121627 RepID=A0A7H8QRW6_TALRU|nr:uncharacterized protein TRUGW13939_02972 [Talaromyces rugulosus]QKX55873.1 hypothetical protein TRUGW13939_02972 [Talaromyces rugulosus]
MPCSARHFEAGDEAEPTISLERARRQSAPVAPYESHVGPAAKPIYPPSGLAPHKPRTTPLSPPPTDTIAPSWTIPNTNLPSLQSRPSGSLNFGSASRSSSSPFSTTLPVTSVTTDNQQQSWLPTPPLQQPLAPYQNSTVNHNNNNSLHEDFVLYPSTPVSRPQVNLWDENSPALLSANPKYSVNSTTNNNNHQNLVNRRHTLHSSVNVHQLPRKQVQQFKKFTPQSPGLPSSTSYRFSPAAGQKRLAQRLYANSPRLNRPAVPLFNSIENNQSQFETKNNINNNNTQHRRVMSSSDIISDFPMDLFDISTASPSLDDLTSPASSMMQSPITPFEDYSHLASYSAAPAPPGTVSPKDLALKDPPVSCPPSSFSTDIGTPQSLFDSPDGLFSHSISPAFANADYDLPASNNWDPLMTSEGYLHGDVDIKPSISDLLISDTAGTESRPGKRTRSVSSPSPAKSPKKRSKSVGVKKPSPPKGIDEEVPYDPNDPVAARRYRNTLAARKSRCKKFNERQMHLEQIEELEQQVAALQKKVAFFESFAPSDVTYPG